MFAGFSAGFDQLRDEPTEWKQGGQGYGRRFGSWFGRGAIDGTIQSGVAILDGEDPRYRRSTKKGFWARSMAAAFQSMFPYTTRGGRTFAFSRVAGSFSSGFISNAWYPDSLSHTSDALARGARGLGGDVGNAVFLEFWPDIKKKLPHRKRKP
ncbi:MAG: hypothetical protein HY236_12575 [Acidobacteria bacterium]|nr:hypothetical protein [Acidobacteriota bacterium]